MTTNKRMGLICCDNGRVGEPHICTQSGTPVNVVSDCFLHGPFKGDECPECVPLPINRCRRCGEPKSATIHNRRFEAWDHNFMESV